MADNLVVLDGLGNQKILRAIDLGGGLLAPVHVEEDTQRQELLDAINPGTIAAGQVDVGTTSTPIVAARPGRKQVTISLGAATDLFIGATGVTITSGYRLLGADGNSVVIPGGAAIYGVVAGGGAPLRVTFLENF